MRIAAGVDVGSTQTKAMLLNERREIVGRVLIDTGANVAKAAERAFDELLASAALRRDQVAYVVGTGYGRYKVTFGDAQITEISCHAKGAVFVFPGTRTVIDMGGQDAKGIRVGDGGEVKDFVMNDKCAAGTGRFLANAAEAIGLTLDEIGEISLRATNPVRLSTVCTVFVESDIMAYLAQGKKVEDILGGVHSAIAARTVALVRRVGIEPEVTFTGGVTRNIGMLRALEEKLGLSLNVSPESHFMGALGAALWALERAASQVPAAAGR
ncbi:MAG: 2-hydroxyglutaryl-CoA dehydratase [Candidatus Rokubacteria bacterium]|nr:2-hydroxyglutaryl-CoA dehydratase [Candidatus Rokubacteria bacterium]